MQQHCRYPISSGNSKHQFRNRGRTKPWKVLIIGRTGSGKSLIGTLLHLLDLESRSTTIDGLDMSRIPRQELRSRILSIPQDAVELSGSVYYNLSLSPYPEGDVKDVSDEAMKSAIVRVGLWETINRQDGGLNTDLADIGVSCGQKQVFSLARTLIAAQNRRSEDGGIVLLDEPTSSMDQKTEFNMRRIVREEFAKYTVITVSHSLDAAGDADIIVRMDGGKIVEVRKK